MKGPEFPQPVFVADADQDVYAPSAGHYLYVRNGKLYELPDDDPQYIGQALVFSLNAISEITTLQLARKKGEHPMVQKIKKDHSLDEYVREFHALQRLRLVS